MEENYLHGYFDIINNISTSDSNTNVTEMRMKLPNMILRRLMVS